MTIADPAKEYSLVCCAIQETQHPLAMAVLEAQRSNLARSINTGKAVQEAAEQARSVRHNWMGH